MIAARSSQHEACGCSGALAECSLPSLRGIVHLLCLSNLDANVYETVNRNSRPNERNSGNTRLLCGIRKKNANHHLKCV